MNTSALRWLDQLKSTVRLAAYEKLKLLADLLAFPLRINGTLGKIILLLQINSIIDTVSDEISNFLRQVQKSARRSPKFTSQKTLQQGKIENVVYYMLNFVNIKITDIGQKVNC